GEDPVIDLQGRGNSLGSVLFLGVSLAIIDSERLDGQPGPRKTVGQDRRIETAAEQDHVALSAWKDDGGWRVLILHLLPHEVLRMWLNTSRCIPDSDDTRSANVKVEE